jgi:predicted nucleic acid-binding protein
VNGFLPDTNVLSELITPHPDRKVLRWMAEVQEETLFLSVITPGENPESNRKAQPGKRRGRLDSWLTVDLRLRFEGRILTVDQAIAQRWAR